MNMTNWLIPISIANQLVKFMAVKCVLW